MLGLYVHIPFCLSKCAYCDFHSIVADEELVGNYLDALYNEIRISASIVQSQVISTLYIGGGTPTRLNSRQLEALIVQLKTNFNYAPDFEFTIEANPGTLTEEKAAVLASQGVNRISLGAQAFQNCILRKAGRTHTVEDVYRSVELLKHFGISNINLDLIYGLPNQTLTDWIESLKLATALKPRHLSCYSLTIEENTLFYDLYKNKNLQLPTEEVEFAMFDSNRKILPSIGYRHYEISNFALPGFEAKHNIIYWQNQAYLGLGSGAHGCFNQIRYYNSYDINQYIHNWQELTPAVAHCQYIDLDRTMDETMMLGLRLLDGVKRADFEQRFHHSFDEIYGKEIKKLISRGLLEKNEKCLRLTKQGVSLGNLVFSAFIRGKSQEQTLDK